ICDRDLPWVSVGATRPDYGDAPMIFRRFRVRVTLATVMVLVAVSAVVFSVYRRSELSKYARIQRAAAFVKQIRPSVNLAAYDAQLSTVSADKRYQRVVFTGRGTGSTLSVIVRPERDGDSR